MSTSTAGEKVPSVFLDRDLSWLEFNQRVLHEALDPRTPLLERVKFLAIFSNNLDEFFMKRIGLVKRRMATAGEGIAAGSEAYRHLIRIREAVLPMLAAQAEVVHQRDPGGVNPPRDLPARMVRIDRIPAQQRG
jgi:polyphosphate kinase